MALVTTVRRKQFLFKKEGSKKNLIFTSYHDGKKGEGWSRS